MDRDDEIRVEVQDALHREPSLDERAIRVNVHEGIVYLEGRVSDSVERWSAEERSRAVPGVCDVINQIMIPPAGPSTDGDLQRVAHNAVREFFRDDTGDIRVMVAEGWINLTGWVATNHQRSAAESVLRGISGVKGITNCVRVGPPQRPIFPVPRFAPISKRLN